MEKASVVDEFVRLGNLASYHFADDSGKEWSDGFAAKAEAMKIYHAHPDLQAEMEKHAQFLWSLKLELEMRP